MKTNEKTIAGGFLGFGIYRFIDALHNDEPIGLAVAFITLGLYLLQRAWKQPEKGPAPAPEEKEGTKRNGRPKE